MGYSGGEVPYLKKGNLFKTAIAAISTQGLCSKGWEELQCSVTDRDVQAERNKKEIFANICAAFKPTENSNSRAA